MKLAAVGDDAAYYVRDGKGTRFDADTFLRGLLGADTAIRLVSFLSDPNTAEAAAAMGGEAQDPFALKCRGSSGSLIAYGDLCNAAGAAGVDYVSPGWKAGPKAFTVDLAYIAGLRTFARAFLRLAALGRGFGDASEAVETYLEPDGYFFAVECGGGASGRGPLDFWEIRLRKEYELPISAFMCLYEEQIFAGSGGELTAGRVALDMRYFPGLYVDGMPREKDIRDACSLVAMSIVYALDIAAARKYSVAQDGRVAESASACERFAAAFASALRDAVLSDRVCLCEVCGQPIVCKSRLTKERRRTCSERCRSRKHKEKGAAQDGNA